MNRGAAKARENSRPKQSVKDAHPSGSSVLTIRHDLLTSGLTVLSPESAALTTVPPPLILFRHIASPTVGFTTTTRLLLSTQHRTKVPHCDQFMAHVNWYYGMDNQCDLIIPIIYL